MTNIKLNVNEWLCADDVSRIRVYVQWNESHIFMDARADIDQCIAMYTFYVCIAANAELIFG